jgi:hypothetical protein
VWHFQIHHESGRVNGGSSVSGVSGPAVSLPGQPSFAEWGKVRNDIGAHWLAPVWRLLALF